MSVTTEPTLPVHYSYSPNCSPVPPGTLREVRAIVLHDLEGSLQSGLAAFAQPGGVSAHYVVAEDGTIWLVVPENAVAYHVAAFGPGPSLNRNRPSWLPPYNGRYSAVNAVSIGIELAGYAASGFTPAQYTALGRLVADIAHRWGLGLTYLPSHGAAATVVTHGWLQTDRTDPGPRFAWDAFIAAVEAAQGNGDPAIATGSTETGGEADMPLSEADQAILAVVHGLGADAGSVVAWIEQLGAQDVVIAQLSAENAGLRAEVTAALTAAKAIRRVTVEYADGSTQEVTA